MAGSLEQRGPNTWRIIVSAGFDSKGKRVKMTRICDGTCNDAEHMLTSLLTEVAHGKAVGASDMSLAEWAQILFREYVGVKLAERTRTMYHIVYQTRILPALGHFRLDQLAPC